MTGRKCALDAAGEVGFIVFKTRLAAGELVGGAHCRPHRRRDAKGIGQGAGLGGAGLGLGTLLLLLLRVFGYTARTERLFDRVGGRFDKGRPTETEALFTALLQAAEMMPNQQS